MIIKNTKSKETQESSLSPKHNSSLKSMIYKKFLFVKKEEINKSSEKIKKDFSSSNLNVSSKEIAITEKDLEINNVVTILKKKQKERTKREKAVIAKIIEKSDVFRRFENSTNDKELLDNFVKLTSSHMNYQLLEEKETLFNEGDIGDKFFIILQGNVKIVQYRVRETLFNFEEYVDFLVDLKLKGDLNLVKKIIDENKGIFPVEIKKINELLGLKETIKLRKSIELSQDHLELAKVLEIYKSNKNFNFFIHTKSELVNGKNYFKFLKNSSLKEACKDYEISGIEKRHPIKVYYMHEVSNLDSGSYFGDHALDQVDLLRTATIIGNETTHLGYIDYNVYVKFILKNKQKIEFKECEYLLNKYFYFSVDVHEFHEKYFKFFFFNEKCKGEVLFNEEDSLNNIYLIKEGEVEYTYNNTLNNLINIMKEICGKTGIKYNACNFEEDLGFRHKIIKSMNLHKTFKILISNSEHFYGIDQYFFGIPKYFQLKVTSKSVKYYTVSIDKFEEMLLRNEKLRTILKNGTLNRIKTLHERLADIKKSNLDLLRKEMKDKNVDTEKIETKPKKFNTSVLPLVSSLHSFINNPGSKELKSYQKRDSKVSANCDPNFREEKLTVSVNLLKNITNNKEIMGHNKIVSSPRKSLGEEKKNEIFQNYFPVNSKNDMKFHIVINEKLLNENKNNLDYKQETNDLRQIYNSNAEESHSNIKSNFLSNSIKIKKNDSILNNLNLNKQLNLHKTIERSSLPMIMKSYDNIYFSPYNSNQDKLKNEF